jgi:hypothetical protein
MTEPQLRLLILGAIALAVAIAVLLRRRGLLVRPFPVKRPDIGEGVHLFASRTCRECEPARAALTATYGDQINEVYFDDDPTRFGTLGIEAVPTVMVLGPDGSGLAWKGVPRRSDLPAR